MNGEEIRVLHVDDDPTILDLVETILEREAPEITHLHRDSPASILSFLEQADDRIDCIVSDYDMPSKSGLVLLQECRETYPDVPFILFTGKGDEAVAEEAISLGVTDYVQKGAGADRIELLASKIKNHVSSARAARELKNREEKFRALVEQNLVGIYLIRDDELTYVNPRVAEIFGYSVDEVVGKPPSELVVETDRERVRENIRERLAGDTDSIRYTFSGKRKDGDAIDIEVQGQLIELDDEPAVAGVLLERPS